MSRKKFLKGLLLRTISQPDDVCALDVVIVIVILIVIVSYCYYDYYYYEHEFLLRVSYSFYDGPYFYAHYSYHNVTHTFHHST